MCVGGHAGLQFVIGIVDIDLDAVDERDSLCVCLHALGRELGVRRDERNASLVLFAGIGVGSDCCLLAPVNAAQVGLGDIGAQPDVIEIRKRDHGRTGLSHFSQFRLAHGNDAGRRRAQGCVARVDPRQAQVGVCLGKIGACDGNIFLATAFHGLVVTLLCGGRRLPRTASVQLRPGRGPARRFRPC